MNNTSLLQSREAMLQAAIDILRKLGGSGQAKAVYEQFGQLLGRPLDETEANNVYQILTDSKADSCLVQLDGQCLYINSANDEVFTLEVNTEKTGGAAVNGGNMRAALNQPDDPKEYTPLTTDQADAVVESDELVNANSPEGKAAADPKGAVEDLKADADALINEVDAKAKKSLKDHEIDFLADRLHHDEKKAETEQERIKKHEEQIAKDKSKLMKDLHEAEIRHDEKVINDEAKREAKLDKDILAKN